MTTLNWGIKGTKNQRDLFWKNIDVGSIMYNLWILQQLSMYDKGQYLYSVECQLINIGPLKTLIQCRSYRKNHIRNSFKKVLE